MNPTALQQVLLRQFASREVELEMDEDWLVTDGEFPAIRAQWHPAAGDAAGWLDIDVVLNETRQIELSFAAPPCPSEEACQAALQVFEREALPVLLASCWYVTDDRYMQLDCWQLGVRQWDVFVGEAVSSHADCALPSDWLVSVQKALEAETLSPELHWVQLLHRRDADGKISRAVLLDNQPWPRGEQALQALAWPECSEAYSLSGLLALDIRDY